jgi:hypothetical protein
MLFGYYRITNNGEDEMSQRTTLLISLSLALTAFLCSASAEALNPNSLTGNWEVNTQGRCGGKNAEHLIMRTNSTFEYGRRGVAEAVGFWRIVDDLVVFDMMSSPASFQDIHSELKDMNGYDIYTMQMMPIDLQQDKLDAVASIGGQMKRFNLKRCQ